MPDATSSQRTITLGGRKIAYTVRRSQRAKQNRPARQPAIGLEVVVPARGRLPDVRRCCARRPTGSSRRSTGWPSSHRAMPHPWQTARWLPYQGVDYRLVIRAAPGLRPSGRTTSRRTP